MTPISYQKLDFTQLFLFENFVISQLDEGVVLNKEVHEKLVEALTTHYRGKSYVYITYRANTYSVDPMVYMYSKDIPNLAGICIVTSNPSGKNTAQFESIFFRDQFHVCETLEEGIDWTNKLLHKMRILK